MCIRDSFYAATDEFPVSADGTCPYCRSNDVLYIILKETEDEKKLPDLLSRLEKDGYAEVNLKGVFHKISPV